MSLEISETVTIPAEVEQVYVALRDPDVLRQSIPGCESLCIQDDGTYAATVALKIGPVKARFRGTVALDVSNGPNQLSLTGEGAGGTAGFAKGTSDVTLHPTPQGETQLNYVVNAQVGGRIAQLGSRLVAGTARKLAARFFDQFARSVTASEMAR